MKILSKMAGWCVPALVLAGCVAVAGEPVETEAGTFRVAYDREFLRFGGPVAIPGGGFAEPVPAIGALIVLTEAGEPVPFEQEDAARAAIAAYCAARGDATPVVDFSYRNGPDAANFWSAAPCDEV